jgi:hypothetical protein
VNPQTWNKNKQTKTILPMGYMIFLKVEHHQKKKKKKKKKTTKLNKTKKLSDKKKSRNALKLQIK